MFRSKQSQLNLALARAYAELETLTIGTDEYAAALSVIERLHDLKNKSSDQMDANTKAVIAANLAGILLIIGHEHAHVITTKAFSLLLRPTA
jgi:hypothetical protein